MTARVAWLVVAVFVAAVAWFVLGAVTSITEKRCPDAFTRECAIEYQERP